MKPAIDLRTGQLYLTWTRYSQEFCCGGHVMVSSSVDHGATFTPPINLDPARNGELPVIAVGVDGAVFVDWNDVGVGGLGFPRKRGGFRIVD